MASSDKNKSAPTSSKRSSNFLPATIIFLVIATIGGILFYFNSGSDPSRTDGLESGIPTESETSVSVKTPDQDERMVPPTNNLFDTIITQAVETDATEKQISDDGGMQRQGETNLPSASGPETIRAATTLLPSSEAIDRKVASQCEKATTTILQFYQHLDRQEYIKSYQLTTSSEEHFITLIHKLLDNPPQVTRETDDLYTILKNTAHFFRVSGKDNILMLKGILDSERGRLEELLADYYFLVTSPDCTNTPYGKDIEQDSLYEYGCFFINTMGGRLYLFRRDTLSRMVVTYYAILLINQANEQNNNHHGIDLKPAIDMLIVEMEGGGSTLQRQESYLDRLYELKEQYQ